MNPETERSQRHRALLRRFEPVIHYTNGEHFFPTDVDTYVQEASLWVLRLDEQPDCLIPEEKLTLEKLAEPRPEILGAVTYIKFIKPLDVAALASYRLKQIGRSLLHKKDQNIFRAGLGRLARVGYSSRFVDALFSLSLLARGRVPGDAGAAAALVYKKMQVEHEHYCYYGRVIHQSSWVVLQYWFFYVFNNWRSGFFGVNDHESDWEMINIYLSGSETSEPKPEWIAYASHDFSGDDLRRRWDDPEAQKVGEHPVIYAGAGSHASYFSKGEYLAEMELPFLVPLVRLMDKVQIILKRKPDQERNTSGKKGSSFNVFRIPFVDYARGDGLSIGEGQEKSWDEPNLIEPAPPWVKNYHGLWGFFARDPISGENAPAGPRYNRDGSVRRVWYDPVGWAGLDKVPPPDRVPEVINQRQVELETERKTISREIEQKQERLFDLGVEINSMRDQPHLKANYQKCQTEITTLSTELSTLRAHLAEDEAIMEALEQYTERIRRGEREPARAHIQRAHHPETATENRFGRMAEVWAAASISLMIIGFVALVIFWRRYLIFGLVALVSLIVFIEAGFRRQLSSLITSLTTGLAIVAALVLLFEFFWEIVVMAVLVAGGYMLWENLRELWA